MKINPDFDGVFRFTNNTNEDFTVMWNNKEYTFKAKTSSPLIIQGETLENIQEIRKKFAYKLAIREFYKGEVYAKMDGETNSVNRGVPALFDEKILEPLIEECLVPLPIVHAEIRELPHDDDSNYTSKSFGEDNMSLGNVNEAYKDQQVRVLGRMPGSAMPGTPNVPGIN